MQSAEERRRLMDRLGTESISPLGAILKCVAGVLVLVGIAAGPWTFLSAGGPTAAKEGHPAPQPDAALAESKRIFDGRRMAHEAERGGSAADADNATRQRLASE